MKKGLGKGLSALLGEAEDVYGEKSSTFNNSNQAQLAVTLLKPGKYQPRRIFDDSAFQDLVESVKQHGILQPLLVRPLPQSSLYEIIAGERRWRAAQKAGLHDVPVVIREMEDVKALEIGLVENLQRQDLSPLEEAEGYQRLQNEFNYTQIQLSSIIGKSRSHIANTLRLLALPDSVKFMVNAGELSAGHARALLGSNQPELLAQKVIQENLNVRQVEKLVQKQDAPVTIKAEKSGDVRLLEQHLSSYLGLAVQVKSKSKGGELVVSYQNLDELDMLIRRFLPEAAMPDQE
ncbi:MAG: ParB/RepB/Spo0J family partition protein [Alphaproteobacteria bacterium]